MLMQCNAVLKGITPPVAKMSPDTPVEIGKRLRHLRSAFGFGDSPTRWAEWLGGVTPNQWAFYEKGERWLPPEVAIRVCVRTGVSADWLYRALEGSVQADTLAKLRAAPESDQLPPARKRAAGSKELC